MIWNKLCFSFFYIIHLLIEITVMTYISRLHSCEIASNPAWNFHTKLILNNVNPVRFLAPNVKINERWRLYAHSQLCTYDSGLGGSGTKWVFSLLRPCSFFSFPLNEVTAGRLDFLFFFLMSLMWGLRCCRENTFMCMQGLCASSGDVD